MAVRVVTAEQAAEADARAIARGSASRTLMQAAGQAAAAILLERFPREAARGVAIYAGPGNNGGDAWVVAGALAQRGVRVRVWEIVPAKTADAIAARDATREVLPQTLSDGSEGVVVDGLLGTGATGAPRGAIADAIAAITRRAEADRSARIVALDVPSGIDATTGAAAGAYVRADCTITFGTMKRGLLRNRDAVGTIVMVDIGLDRDHLLREAASVGAAPADTGDATGRMPVLMDVALVRSLLPPVGAAAHKGTRKRLLIIGGAQGMAGAAVLAARGAQRSGIGMVKLCVAPASMGAVQAAEPAAMASVWPSAYTHAAEWDEALRWPHVVLLGPGIGRSPESRALVERTLATWRGPLVLDADALNVFEGQADRLAGFLQGRGERRATVVTPHVVEFSRLAGISPEVADTTRFEAAGDLARRLGATVLLKGVPTVVSDGDRTFVSASGTPVLGTAGSGDILAGMVATLVAQMDAPVESAACAAWVHGRAAEIAGAGDVRGVTLDDVMHALRNTWRLEGAVPTPPTLAVLPAPGEAR